MDAIFKSSTSKDINFSMKMFELLAIKVIPVCYTVILIPVNIGINVLVVIALFTSESACVQKL